MAFSPIAIFSSYAGLPSENFIRVWKPMSEVSIDGVFQQAVLLEVPWGT